MLYNSFEVPTSVGTVTLCSNEVKCTLCNLIFKSKLAFYNHTKSNGCFGNCDLICFCGEDLNRHYCKYLGKCKCSSCGYSFKTVEAGINHCMNTHHDGSYWNISKFLIFDDSTHVNPKFMPNAQCNNCRNHWNYGQFALWWKSGDSARKRMLTRKVLSTEHHECSILELISIRGKLVCWYKKPQRHNLRIFDIQTKIGKLQVHLDESQNDFRKIYGNIESMILNPVNYSRFNVRQAKDYNNSVLESFSDWKNVPSAQGFFDFTVNHNISIEPVIEQLSTLAKNTFTGNNLKRILSLLTKIGICYSSKWNSNIVSLVLLDFFLSFDIPVEDASGAMKIVVGCLPLILTAFFGREAQADCDDSSDLIKALATVVSIFFGTVFLKSVPNKSTVDEFVASATKFGNLMRALDNSWKGLGKLVNFVYDYCFEFFYGYTKEIGEAEKFITGIEQWAIEVGKLSNNEVIERIQVDAVLCRQIERLYLQGVTFTTRCVHLKMSPDMKRSIENCHRVISALNDKVSKSGAFCSGPKVEPLIVQLFGESGVGKSGMMFLLSGDILKTEDILCGGDGTVSDDWANQIYPRNVEQEFFDGYRNQLIVLYDDFGQLRDSQAKPNTEFMEMIRFGNLAPMCLHMAALEQKDKTYFSSKCVLLSSNCREYAIESLISKDAFMRRIDISVEVRVKSEWRKPESEKLDTEKVVAHFKSPCVPEIYECRIWRDNQPSPIWISYDSLRDIVCRSYATKMNRHFELTSVLSDYMKVPLKIDISKIKEELNRKFKVNPTKHYTMEDLFPEAQMMNRDEDYHDALIEQNCTPNFPEPIRRTSVFNHKKWNRKVTSEISDTMQYLAFSHCFQEHDWHITFDDFGESLMTALEECDGDWKRVLNFLSNHLSFLSVKTQVAFARPEFRDILSNPETAIDFLTNGIIECENAQCWHPSLERTEFGFHKGCSDDLIKFISNRLNHRDTGLYDCFMNFNIVVPTMKNKVTTKFMTYIKTIKEHGLNFIENATNWFTDNPGALAIFGYFAILGAVAFGVYHSTLSSEKSEYDKAKQDYQDAVEAYHVALSRLRAAEVNLSHKHEGLELGSYHKHSHTCEKCGMTFVHAHTIKLEEESMKYPHLCYKCRKIVSEFQSGDNVTTHQARPKVENSQSGDNVTTHQIKPKVENSQSGDNVTTHQPKLRVEAEPTAENSQSGDNVTTHAPRPVVQDSFKDFTKEVMLESNIDDDDFLQKHVSKEMHREHPIAAQLATDPNAMTLGKRIYVNTYMISTRNDPTEQWKQRVNCVFVRGRVAITVAHLEPILVAAAMGEIKIDGPFKNEGYVMPVRELRFKKLTYANGEFKDAMLIIFPSVVHDHQDVLTSIADSETMSKFKEVPAMLLTPTIIKDRNIYNQRFATARAVDNEKPLAYSDPNALGGLRYLRMHYQYVMNTTNGDCGSVLVALSNYLPKKIIGLHVAGDASGKGYAVPLNVKDIEDVLKSVPKEAQIKIDLGRFEKEDGELSSTPDGDFSPAIKSDLIVASPTKTALRPSMIHGHVLEPISAPAHLSRRVKLEDGTIHDPVLAGLKKTGKIPPFVEPELIKAAVNDVLRIHQTNDKTRKRVLTNMEALTGVTDDPYSNPLNRSSSPGYPWIKTRVGKGKMKWTSDPQGEYKMHVELEKAIEDREEMALNNERYPTIWIDTLKDERRPLEKVRVGKTRVFAAGSLDYIVIARKYFLGFCAHMAENRINNEVAVGINPYSYDWTHLARHLQKFGHKVVAGDFGNFDGTLLLQILEAIGEMINDWYDDGEENRQIRTILWKELTNSIHIEGDNIYFWSHGHPSGHPLTAILNSIYNSVVCRIVFVLSAREVKKQVTMKDFNENVAMISYGDDNVLNISDRVVDFFNQHSMSRCFATIGMEYTDELKSSAADVKPYRHLNEVSFLKRKFRFDEERQCYTAPLDYSVCMEMVNWIRGELDPEEACCTNCQTSAMELSLHGREVFEASTKLIKRACLTNMNRQPMILTYNEYMETFESSYGQIMENPNLELGA